MGTTKARFGDTRNRNYGSIAVPLFAPWTPVFAGERDVGPPKG